ncbi:ubiquitin-specific protease ubp2 [Coemansia sp. RSA 1200]|nr:ubiquitin-specific protease ubp2 [Coemansia sp. RSA 1200]
MSTAEQPRHTRGAGVLAAYFATVQLSEWVPAEIARQLPAKERHQHRHTWVRTAAPSAPATPSQQQQQKEQQHRASADGSAWRGCCKDCLCRLAVSVDTSVAHACIDSTGHHMHSVLGRTTSDEEEEESDNNGAGVEEEAYTGGASRCCKCGVSATLRLWPAVVDPEMVAALEEARTKPHAHHPAQGSRELLGTVTTLYRVVRNVCQGNRSPVKTGSAKPRQLLKFDAPCNQILGILGFELTNNESEFRPPDVGTAGDGGSSLMLRRLERARDELGVLAGRIQRRLRDVERNAAYVYRPVTPDLAALLGAKDYPRRAGASALLMATATGSSDGSRRPAVDDAYRQLGVPEDAADELVVWSYGRLSEEDESPDPLAGPQAQRRFDALAAIAEFRTSSSDALDDLVASERGRGMATTEQTRLACRALFGDSGYEVAAIDDDTMREMARSQIAEASSVKAKTEVAEHLRVLAAAKHSQPLANYAAALASELEARAVAVDEPAADHETLAQIRRQMDTWGQLPVGLTNIGNTCYLNSILQFIYSVAPIRQAVMRYGDAQTWNEPLVLGRRDGGRLLTTDEVKRALRFVELLKRLFSNLINHRIECWSLSDARKEESTTAPGHPLLTAPAFSASTALAVTPDRELSDMLLQKSTGANGGASNNNEAATSVSSSGTLNMQLDTADANGKATAATTASQQKPATTQYYQQQDVDEFIEQFVAFLVHALPPEPRLHLEENSTTESDASQLPPTLPAHDDGSWIRSLLYGHQELLAEKYGPGGTRVADSDDLRKVPYAKLILSIPGAESSTDINDCIDGYFAPSVISGANQDEDDDELKSSQMMDVDRAHEKGEVEIVQRTRLLDAPPVLCVQIQRLRFDVSTMRSYKLNTHIRLRRQISLAPYMQFSAQQDPHASGEEEAADPNARRTRIRQIKTRVETLSKHLRALETPVRAASGFDAMASMSVVSALERVQTFMAGVSGWSESSGARSLLADLGKPADAVVGDARKLSSDLGTMARALTDARTQWDDERRALCAELDSIYDSVSVDDANAYTLHAVFIHSGLSPEYGHYWVYIRDYDSKTEKTRWLCFNDSNVSVIGDDAVFGDSPLPGQEAANPYLLVYVRSNELSDVVDFGI